MFFENYDLLQKFGKCVNFDKNLFLVLFKMDQIVKKFQLTNI